jgi:hypothetical protein
MSVVSVRKPGVRTEWIRAAGAAKRLGIARKTFVQKVAPALAIRYREIPGLTARIYRLADVEAAIAKIAAAEEATARDSAPNQSVGKTSPSSKRKAARAR